MDMMVVGGVGWRGVVVSEVCRARGVTSQAPTPRQHATTLLHGHLCFVVLCCVVSCLST